MIHEEGASTYTLSVLPLSSSHKYSVCGLPIQLLLPLLLLLLLLLFNQNACSMAYCGIFPCRILRSFATRTPWPPTLNIREHPRALHITRMFTHSPPSTPIHRDIALQMSCEQQQHQWRWRRRSCDAFFGRRPRIYGAVLCPAGEHQWKRGG